MPTDTRPAPIPIVSSIVDIAQGKSAWLVDIWGVMHNGVVPFAGAVDACQQFRSGGGTVLLLSNSPRPSPGVRAQLDDIGVSRSAYDGIVSSGDATRALISKWGGRPVFHLGPARDAPLFDGLGVAIVDQDKAEGIVCSGLFDDTTETPEDYRALLSGFAARRLPMICANPDIKVERDGQVIYCAGALAEAYASLGGEVALAGKPHLPIYGMAFEELARLQGSPVDAADCLAIGDGVKTDIAGAAAASVVAVYIASAVHMGQGAVLDAATLEQLFPAAQGRPVAAMTQLAW